MSLGPQEAEWVEIIEPRTKEHMYANLTTGECVWDPPPGVPVKRTNDHQWWELFDQNTSRFYYYNATTQKTVWHRPENCDIIPLAKLQTLKQNTEVKEEDTKALENRSAQTTSALAYGKPLGEAFSNLKKKTKLTLSSLTQTSPVNSPRVVRKVKHHQFHHHGNRHHRTKSDVSHALSSPPSSSEKSRHDLTSPQRQPYSPHHSSHRYLPTEQPTRHGEDKRRTTIGPSQSKYYSIPHNSVRDVAKSRRPERPPSPGSLAKQRSLEGDHFRIATQLSLPPTQDQDLVSGNSSLRLGPKLPPPIPDESLPPLSSSNISRSISFMAKHPLPTSKLQEENIWKPPPGFESVNGKKSVESTPQSLRRHKGSPESNHSGSSSHYANSHSDVSSPIDGYCTPMINRKQKSLNTSFEGSGSNGTRSSLMQRSAKGFKEPPQSSQTQQLAEKLDQENGSDVGKNGELSKSSIVDNDFSTNEENKMQDSRFKAPLNNISHRYKAQKPRRGRGGGGDNNGTWDRFHHVNKMSPLQQYILEQAKLSGYRFGDGLDTTDRDSFVESEDDWMNHHDDSDDFADDEDGGVSDDVSKASSVDGEDDRFLTEPTYNNLDPKWIESMYTAGYPHNSSMFPGMVSGSTLERNSSNQAPQPALGSNATPQQHSHHHLRPAPPVPPHQIPIPSSQTRISQDVDAFSEEFDVRMRFNNRSQGNPNSSTMPRPSSHGPTLQQNPSFPVPYDVLHHPSLQRNTQSLMETNSNVSTLRGGTLGRVNSRTSDVTESRVSGSMLSVSTSIHSTISCESDIEKYALDNLNIQKKGLFRKKLTVKDILTHSKESLKKPLTCLADKALKKEAVDIFRLMQIYMGDRRAKQGMTINSVALDITHKGYLSPKIRDEIYVQLCKQTTENSNRESLRRGWELMAICLSFFPPSVTFSLALHAYIHKHRDPGLDYPDVGKWPIHVQISHYAGICAKRLDRIGESGRLSPKKPVIEDIDQSRLQIFRPSMFGGTLTEILDMQKDRFPHRKLPWILTTLAEQIIQLNGLATEGIFRVPADLDEVNNVKTRFDQWEIPACADCHTAASLLKLWFRELYEPIIPDALYEESVQVGENIQAACDIVARIPPPNHDILLFLIRFLQLFASPEVAQVTKMDASNLSTVFAPNCLRCPSMDPSVILENTRKEMAFVKALVFGLDTTAMEGVL